MDQMKKELIEMITGISDINTVEYLHEYIKLILEPQEV